MNINFEKILNFINPQFSVGGLEFSDSYVRFFVIKGEKADSYALKLPPDVIKNGKINNKDQLVAILSELHQKAISKKKKLYVIASISDSNVYTEKFSLPKSAVNSIDEAAALNLQIISPVDFNSSYSDWQFVGERTNNGENQIELLGAFVSKQIVDEYENVMDKAGFSEAAVEFPALALARSLMEFGSGLSKDKNYLLLKIGNDGLSFGMIKNRNLYFMHFISWASTYGEQRTVSFESLKKLIIEEIQKVISFHETHSPGPIDGLLLVSSTMIEQISKIISENFKTINLQIPAMKDFPNLSPSWFSVLGSALRGSVPRSQDFLISLASAGTEEKFESHLMVSFVKSWRNLVLVFLSVIIITFLGTDIFISRNIIQLDKKIAEFSIKPETSKLIAFQTEAQEFNKKVDILYDAYKNRTHWIPYLNRINEVPVDGIILKRIFIQAMNLPVLLVGGSVDEDSIIRFKKSLEQKQFSNVNFQLTNVTKSEKGGFNFSMSFGF
ncbi:MAG: hypothetical protein QMD86_02560 [Patescibacteria group bacterium]|nr:hypothetical protein [Patescibacteria group bacterium]